MVAAAVAIGKMEDLIEKSDFAAEIVWPLVADFAQSSQKSQSDLAQDLLVPAWLVEVMVEPETFDWFGASYFH